ncbi:MAG: efflux RND transporter periplasmic adaptor subunit [Candidatus Hydrogenedentes bacterium]|nr:efflux RND transporter periplasmic adaptor subunit [Candidatus Hydrogenedentota bacterium]
MKRTIQFNASTTRMSLIWGIFLLSVLLLTGCSGQTAVLAESRDAAAPPATRDPARLWCNEHNVYEDECVLCHPELAAEHAEDSHEHGDQEDHEHGDGLWCEEHNVAESECGICHPELVKTLQLGQSLKVRFGTNDTILKSGVTLGKPDRSLVVDGIEALGRVSYNRNKLALITPLAGGVLTKVNVDVGAEVQAGDLLAEVNASAIADAAGAYARALAEQKLRAQVYAREKDLVDRAISARQDYEEARAALEASQSAAQQAKQTLLSLGIAPDEVARYSANGGAPVMPIRAPFAGTIVDRSAVTGAAVSPGNPIVELADLSVMWLELSVAETHLAALREGMLVEARFDAYPDQEFRGVLEWIASRVDEQTRRVEARAVLSNEDGLLKHGMFGRATLAGESMASGFSVPESAVQILDGQPMVFARLEDDLFETRLVQVGAATQGRIPVLAGVSAEDEIVFSESYLLKAELLKARLGAGCADH